MKENKFTGMAADQAEVDAQALGADAQSGILELEELDDAQLVSLAKTGNLDAEEHLIRKYKGLVKNKSQFYFIIGADGDDVMQEGMIGLFKAIHSFDAKGGAAFKNFADLCISRQIVSAIRSASRKKHKPLNESVSLNDPAAVGNAESENKSGMTLQEIIRGSREMEPEQELMMKTLMEQISNNENDVFSSFELQVWELYSRGMNYREIADELDRSPKSVDNAIQRTKKKIMDSICG